MNTFIHTALCRLQKIELISLFFRANFPSKYKIQVDIAFRHCNCPGMKSTRNKRNIKLKKINQKKSYDLQCPVSFCLVLPESGSSHQVPLPNYDRGDDEGDCEKENDNHDGNVMILMSIRNDPAMLMSNEYDDRNTMVKTPGPRPCQRRRSRPLDQWSLIHDIQSLVEAHSHLLHACSNRCPGHSFYLYFFLYIFF